MRLPILTATNPNASSVFDTFRRGASCGSFGNEGLHDVVVLERTISKGLYVKLYGRFHFGKGFFVGIPLGNDDTPQSQRVSDIAVRVLLDDDLREVHPRSIGMRQYV